VTRYTRSISGWQADASTVARHAGESCRQVAAASGPLAAEVGENRPALAREEPPSAAEFERLLAEGAGIGADAVRRQAAES